MIEPSTRREEPRDEAAGAHGPLREGWEVLAALGVMAVVLVALDVGWLGSPRLVLSLVPLLFLVTAAFARLGPVLIVLWLGGCLLVALLAGDAAYAGLGYPAVVAAVLVGLRALARGLHAK